MLIKSADYKESQIAILQNLLSHERVPAEKRQLIERELRSLSIGIATEKQAAFEIDFYAVPSKNLFVIHDLRLEIGGRVAQIDHILMNRALEVFVIETKTFSTGLSINDRGEFSTFYEGKEVGIPSPVEQNARHISVLKDAFKEIGLPKRLGITLQPSFNSVVLVSPKAIINRQKLADLDASIIKLDQFFSWYHKKMDAMTLKDTVGILKVCSSDTVKNLGEKLLSLHKPSRVDYIKRFELRPALLSKKPVDPVHAEQENAIALEALQRKTETEYFCANCKTSIASVVAKYCWNNKSRFSGKAYCRACQTKV
ncbi:nuclease-related domain-containing protein [Massilia sp. CMS3.1]|uniref:nuclease-related domain-containing protein n=1 Tax=Massilia sp. CMS3.1 TaxID=3373083 RepID=UPI003EE47764